jgi:hypothetical protein
VTLWDRVKSVVGAEVTSVRQRVGDAFRVSSEGPADADPDHSSPAPLRTTAIASLDAARRLLELQGNDDLAVVRATYDALARQAWQQSQSADARVAGDGEEMLFALTDALRFVEEQLLPMT